MRKKETPPTISQKAFDCPHCGVFTSQNWHDAFAARIDPKSDIPFLISAQFRADFLKKDDTDHKVDEDLIKWLDKAATGLPFLEDSSEDRRTYLVCNLHLSKCYNCGEISIWVHDKLLFPPYSTVLTANSDMPADIRRDFDEAKSILDKSPRGAAALLRLCVQKLCVSLGEKGKNIDHDIASLVAKGLDPLVQQSLDIVRVIGNDSVHPGVMDLSDSREDAIQLFHLLNSICDQMITHPNTVRALYSKLPEAKRKAIEERNAKATTPKSSLC